VNGWGRAPRGGGGEGVDVEVLNDLRQEHFPTTEEVADLGHPRHERTFNDVQRPLSREPRLLRVCEDELDVALDESIRQSLIHRERPPLLRRRFVEVGPRSSSLGLLLQLRSREELLSGVVRAVEDGVLDELEEVWRDVCVQGKCAGVDDGHIHPRLDGVVEEDRVHGLADVLETTEGEGEVGEATADVSSGESRADDAGGLDEVHPVVVVLGDARADGENVGVKDDVLTGEAHLIHEEAIGPCADAHFIIASGGLTFLIKGHHHHRRTVAQDSAGLSEDRTRGAGDERG
jgi:hypothetical protein